MSNETEFTNKIKTLKTAKGFTVETEAQRQQVSRLAKQMKRWGLIDFDVVTKADGDKFKVVAI